MRAKFPKFITTLLVSSLVFFVTACGGAKTLAPDLDLSTLAGDLLGNMAFEDKDFAPLPEQLWDRYIDQVDRADLEAHVVIAGGGITAEEIALFEAVDETAAKRVEQAMKDRFEYFRTSFGNYTPEQLVNLEDPALIRNGNYVFSVISGENDKARELINSWISKQK